MWRGLPFIAIVLLSACPSSEADLKKPIFEENWGNGLCGSHTWVDGDRNGWFEHGCEGHSSGLQHRSNLTATELEQVKSAFDSLPPPGTPCATDGGSSDGRTSFSILMVDGGRTTWQACAVDSDTLEEPYRGVENTLVRLVP